VVKDLSAHVLVPALDALHVNSLDGVSRATNFKGMSKGVISPAKTNIKSLQPRVIKALMVRLDGSDTASDKEDDNDVNDGEQRYENVSVTSKTSKRL
jgi:hypothetical protein